MPKKTSKTVDKLRGDVQALTEAVWALKEHVRVEAAAESAANGSRNQKSGRLSRLEKQAQVDDSRGLVSIYGSFRLPEQAGTERRAHWQLENQTVESLIPDDIEAAAQQLGAIGHRQRLAILIALLQQPSSVSDLVTSLGLGTSGAAYHHLNVLQGTGYVTQQERGIYEVAPEQVGCIAGILAALAATPTIEDVAVAGESASDDVDEDVPESA